MDRILPSYKTDLEKKVRTAIDKKYPDREATRYIENWYEPYDDFGNGNFYLCYNDQAREYLDLDSTLHSMDGELLLKVAIDLGIETPNYIPSIPIFRNEIKSSYQFASRVFEKAFREIESDPATACGLAVAALESIIKEILNDERITIQYRDKGDIHKLMDDILKAYSLLPNSHILGEIRTLVSGLQKCATALGDIRGDKSSLHGHKTGDILISDSASAYFIVNAVTSIGLYLIQIYKNQYPPTYLSSSDDDLPF